MYIYIITTRMSGWNWPIFNYVRKTAGIKNQQEIEQERAIQRMIERRQREDDRADVHRANLAFASERRQREERDRIQREERDRIQQEEREQIQRLEREQIEQQTQENIQKFVGSSSKFPNLNNLKQLLSEVPDINVQYRDNTALDIQTMYGSIPAMTWLIQNGANPNIQSTVNGYTTLHKAVLFSNDFAKIQLLIRGGADIFIRDNYGNTAQHYARANARDPRIINILETSPSWSRRQQEPGGKSDAVVDVRDYNFLPPPQPMPTPSSTSRNTRANIQQASTRLEGMSRDKNYTYADLLDAARPSGDINTQLKHNVGYVGVHRIPPKNPQLVITMLRSCFAEIPLSQYDITVQQTANKIKREMVESLTDEAYNSITPEVKRRMVDESLSCIAGQRTSGQYGDIVTGLELFELTYRFITNQSNPRFKTYFVSQWVREIIEAYIDEPEDRGVTLKTYAVHPNPHTSCQPGAVHRIIDVLSQTLVTVMDLTIIPTSNEVEAEKRQRRTRLVNEWSQQATEEINSNEKLVNYINRRIRAQPVDNNTDEWRVDVPGSEPLTIEQYVASLNIYGGRKLKNKRLLSKRRLTKRPLTKGTRAKRPLTKRK
jgi:hypothetical protein